MVASADQFETADINLRVGTYIADGKPISCEDGKRQLQELGFQDVQATDCAEKTNTYRVRRAGAQYEVVITSDQGRVVRRTAF